MFGEVESQEAIGRKRREAKRETKVPKGAERCSLVYWRSKVSSAQRAPVLPLLEKPFRN